MNRFRELWRRATGTSWGVKKRTFSQNVPALVRNLFWIWRRILRTEILNGTCGGYRSGRFSSSSPSLAKKCPLHRIWFAVQRHNEVTVSWCRGSRPGLRAGGRGPGRRSMTPRVWGPQPPARAAPSPPEPVLHVAYRHLYLVYTEYLLAYLPNILLNLDSASTGKNYQFITPHVRVKRVKPEQAQRFRRNFKSETR